MDHTSSTPLHLGNAAYTGTNHKRRGNAYKFPILKTSEIIDCLKELEVFGENPVITKEELEEPQHCKEKLGYCAGKDETNCKPTKAMSDYVDTLDHPELHPPESFMEMHFFIALRQLMAQCLYSEFSWRDLHAPTATRLRIQLSALINLVKYLEGEQLKIFNELNGPRTELITALEETKVEHDEVEKAYLVAEELAKQKREQMNEVIRECEKLELEISRNNRLQKATREESSVVKKAATDLNDKLQTALWALQELEAEEERLRPQIAANPMQRKTELREWTEKVQTEKWECERLEVEIEESKTKYANALKIYQDFSSCIKDMDELQEVASKYSQSLEKLNDVHRQTDEITKKTDEINQQIVDSERDTFRLEEKFKAQRLQHQMKMVTLQECMDAAKRDLLRIEKDRREAISRMDAAEREVQALKVMIEQEQKKGQSEIDMMVSKYKTVEKRFLERNNKLTEHLLSITDTDETSNKENSVCVENTDIDVANK